MDSVNWNLQKIMSTHFSLILLFLSPLQKKKSQTRAYMYSNKTIFEFHRLSWPLAHFFIFSDWRPYKM